MARLREIATSSIYEYSRTRQNRYWHRVRFVFSPVNASRLFALCIVVSGALFIISSGAEPIRPLAQEFVVVAESPDSATTFCYNPAILRLDSGRLVASYGLGGRESPEYIKQSPSKILTSDDGGQTWIERHSARVRGERLFRAGESIYLIGQDGDVVILRSDDEGETWSDPAPLTTDRYWHSSAANVWHAKGNVYLVIEQRVTNEIKAWPVGKLAPVLMRANENADLTKRENWTFASRLPFSEIIPGYAENALDIEWFGVPFFPQNFPENQTLPGDRKSAPIGWLETNVVQILDPNHYWHDPEGNTFHLFMRAHTGGTGYAALAKAIENPDGSITTSLVEAPSGKKILFLPFPGGQMRFHVLYDEKTKLYWMLGSQATDSMTRTDLLPEDRFDLPNNERHRMVLHFSKNMVDWCFAGVVAIGDTPLHSRHYACMDIDGEDLVILSRSGNEFAKSAHDGNLITFHRVKDFRSLVY